MSNFYSLNLPKSLAESINYMGYKDPTEIQSKAIPIALQGKDIIGTAQTGTGKTAAFLIPIFVKLLESKESNALIIAPTRELALQISKVAADLMPMKINFATASLVGGASIFKQLQQLKAKPRIVIGTPGRINDHLTRKSLNLKHYNLLVLDEFDRMLDIGFSPQIKKIVDFLPEKRQTMMFSATLTPEIIKLSKKYLNNPETINVGSANTPARNIDQQIINTTINSKYDDLLSELSKRNGSIIIFVNTKRGAEKLSFKLNNDKQHTSSLHGDLPHRKRERVVNEFKAKGFRIMVATDIAARGLDIDHIKHVINYDLPRDAQDYVHRIGRTARAGADGAALNFLLPEDNKKWATIKSLMKQAS